MNAPLQLSRKKVAKHPALRWDALNEFCAFADLTKLTPIQKVVYLTYWYMSTVKIGGHHDYFSHRPHSEFEEAVAALQTVGATEQVPVLTAALRAIADAGDRVPAEYKDRHRAGVEFADLMEFDEAFDRCKRSIADSLLDFLDKHESDFIEWKP